MHHNPVSPETAALLQSIARSSDALVQRLGAASAVDDDVALLTVELKPRLDQFFGRQAPPGAPL